MKESDNAELDILWIKVVQSGELKKIPLSEVNLSKKFKDIYFPMLKELKLKQNYAFLTDETGKMLGPLDIADSVENIVKKFGSKLELYYEKIM